MPPPAPALPLPPVLAPELAALAVDEAVTVVLAAGPFPPAPAASDEAPCAHAPGIKARTMVTNRKAPHFTHFIPAMLPHPLTGTQRRPLPSDAVVSRAMPDAPTWTIQLPSSLDAADARRRRFRQV